MITLIALITCLISNDVVSNWEERAALLLIWLLWDALWSLTFIIIMNLIGYWLVQISL
jgi:hypothetical protein